MLGSVRTAMFPPYPTQMLSLTGLITDTGKGVIVFPVGELHVEAVVLSGKFLI